MNTLTIRKVVTKCTGSEFVCFLCGRLYKVISDESNKPNEKSKQQHFQKLFKCCSKFEWPNSLSKYFQFNFDDSINKQEMCTDCVQSLEKLFEMNELLEEMLDGIKNFIDVFAKEVLDHQNQSDLEKETLQTEKPSEDSLLKDTYLEYTEKIEENWDYPDSSFQVEDTEEMYATEDFKEESFILTEYNDTFQDNSLSLSLRINCPEENSRAQEELLISNYNASDLGVMYQLKPLRIVLQRLQVSAVENEISNDCETGNDIFKCNVCPAKFHKKIVFTRHLLTHENDADIVAQNHLKDNVEKFLKLPREKRKAAKAANDAMKKFVEMENEPVDIYATKQAESDTENRTSDLDSGSELSEESNLGNSCENDTGNKEVVPRLFTFCCKICLNSFHTEGRLKRHLVSNHDIRGDKSSHVTFKCKICANIFPIRYLLKRHLKLKHNNDLSNKTFKCTICQKIFPSRYLLDRDLIMHQRISYQVAKRFKCLSCKFSCNFVKQLLAHSVETGHSNEKSFKCNPCGRTFYKLTDLKNHKLKVHKILKCLKCLKTFQRKQSLIKHIKMLHHNKLSFKCDVCEKEFPHKINLTRHYATHKIKSWPFKCKICNTTFKFKILLDEHNHVHDKGEFKCTTCMKEFKTKYSLYQHFLIHTTIRDKKLKHYYMFLKKKIKCRICRKVFSTKNRLKQHHSVHITYWGELIRKGKKSFVSDKSGLSKFTSLNLFECQLCQRIICKTVKLSLKASLERHRRQKHKNEKFHGCEICGYFFKSSDELEDHKNLFVNEPEVYKCEFCNEIFHTKFAIDIHRKYNVCNCNTKKVDFIFDETCVEDNFVKIDSKSSQGDISYDFKNVVKCKICHILVGSEKMECHFKTHSPNKCNICGLTFISTKGFNQHRTKAHSDNLPHKCSFCDLQFTTVDNRKMHEKENHSSKKKYTCDFCGSVLNYSRWKDFLTHQRTHFITYNCKVCDKKYKSRIQVENHQKSFHYNDYGNLQCEYCSKKFRYQYGLNKHIGRIHLGERPFKCSKCDKTFIEKHDLNAHSDIHADVKFPCKICGKNFNRKMNLNVHFSTVHSNKSFQCEICGKSCKRKDNLITHMRSHSGEKPYQCQECGKSFTRLDNLNVHLKWHEKCKRSKNTIEENVDIGESSDED